VPQPPPRPQDDLVDVIDAAGRTVGAVSRAEMRRRRLPHRCCYILVCNSRGELLIHLRTATKDVYPSHWDVTVGGVLQAGESFADGARRELAEELGVSAPLEELCPFHYADEATEVRAVVYRTTHDGPFVLQPEEVVRAEFVPLSELPARLRQAPFCPDGLEVLRRFGKGIASAELGARNSERT
jgi:isopentenyldiphosphate isomerase